jgi:RND family efflux transporter MFP subunit
LSALVLAGCMPEMPEIPNEPVRRNVAVELVKPQLIEIPVKLPVNIKPREVIELRAKLAGTLISLPFEESNVVPASELPASTWIELDEFTKANPGVAPLDEACMFRNLKHLEGLKPFALVDDRAARINFRDAQVQYDAAVRALARVQNYKDSTEAAVDMARTQALAARAACDRLRHMIEDCYVNNPRQGVLTKRMRRAGEYVNVGELIGTVAVLDPLTAELHVPEAHRHALSVGMTLNIAMESVKDALGEPIAIEAKVRLVDAVAHELTHSFRVEADIANPDLKLPAGVFGTTRLIVYRKEAGLRVPLTALKLKKDKISLFVIAADKKVKEIENVTLGRFHDDWAEVLGDAIKPGQEVVVAGAQLLADGDMIAIQVDPTAAKDAKGAKDGRS